MAPNRSCAWTEAAKQFHLLCLARFITAWVLGLCPAKTEASHETRDVNTITADRVKLLLETGEKPLLIDLRPVKEFKQKRLSGSRSIPMTELHSRLGEIPKRDLVILCAASPQNQIMDEVYQFLEDNGYRNVAVMVEGFQGWVKRKYPIESGRR